MACVNIQSAKKKPNLRFNQISKKYAHNIQGYRGRLLCNYKFTHLILK